MEQSSVSDVLYVLVLIGRLGLSFCSQVAVLLPQGSFLQIVRRTMGQYFKRGSVLSRPTKYNHNAFHHMSCIVLLQLQDTELYIRSDVHCTA